MGQEEAQTANVLNLAAGIAAPASAPARAQTNQAARVWLRWVRPKVQMRKTTEYISSQRVLEARHSLLTHQEALSTRETVDRRFAVASRINRGQVSSSRCSRVDGERRGAIFFCLPLSRTSRDAKRPAFPLCLAHRQEERKRISGDGFGMGTVAPGLAPADIQAQDRSSWTRLRGRLTGQDGWQCTNKENLNKKFTNINGARAGFPLCHAHRGGLALPHQPTVPERS